MGINKYFDPQKKESKTIDTNFLNNLKKTKILAPYTGRLQSTNVNIGQFVSPGTLLAQVYATDYVEVRLPLSLGDYEQLKLPESYQNQKSVSKDKLPKVIFSANYGTNDDSRPSLIPSTIGVEKSVRKVRFYGG